MKRTSVKLLAFLLAAFVSVASVSCGGDDGGPATNTNGNDGGNGGGSGDDDSPAPAVKTYDVILKVKGLTDDNFRFFDYKVYLNNDTKNPITLVANGESSLVQINAGTAMTLNIQVTPKENISTLMERETLYRLATTDGFGLRVVNTANYGEKYETPDVEPQVVTNTGRYLLANAGYFCGTVSLVYDGNAVSVGQSTRPALHEPEFEVSVGDAIDLGLSVYWASSNVLTHQQTHNQSYFAWGETKIKNDYTWQTYQWFNYSGGYFTKYYGSVNEMTLEMADDVANVVMGGNWRMPTKAEAQELVSKCKWEWGTYLGFKGYKVTGPNGNSIFLGTYGFLDHNTIELYGFARNNQVAGYYWTRELLSSTGKYAYQQGALIKLDESGYNTTSEMGRFEGCTVRAVLPK